MKSAGVDGIEVGDHGIVRYISHLYRGGVIAVRRSTVTVQWATKMSARKRQTTVPTVRTLEELKTCGHAAFLPDQWREAELAGEQS